MKESARRERWFKRFFFSILCSFRSTSASKLNGWTDLQENKTKASTSKYWYLFTTTSPLQRHITPEIYGNVLSYRHFLLLPIVVNVVVVVMYMQRLAWENIDAYHPVAWFKTTLTKRLITGVTNAQIHSTAVVCDELEKSKNREIKNQRKVQYVSPNICLNNNNNQSGKRGLLNLNDPQKLW